MIRQVYVDFVEKFEGLNPYELDHFSRAIHRRYTLGKKKKSLSKKDLQDILISAIQDLQIEFAEQRLEEAKINLSLIKSRIYKKR
jgi:hypothetical protein